MIERSSKFELKAMSHGAIFERCKLGKYASSLHFANVSLYIKQSSLINIC